MKIEKNIPIPDYRKQSEHYKTIEKMKIGNSVFFDSVKEANKFYGCCMATFHKWTFTRRTLDNGTRIWRIK